MAQSYSRYGTYSLKTPDITLCQSTQDSPLRWTPPSCCLYTVSKMFTKRMRLLLTLRPNAFVKTVSHAYRHSRPQSLLRTSVIVENRLYSVNRERWSFYTWHTHIERRWERCAVSWGSQEMAVMRRPNSIKNLRPVHAVEGAQQFGLGRNLYKLVGSRDSGSLVTFPIRSMFSNPA